MPSPAVQVPPGVAAHHADTADVGRDVLAAGGTAVDAAVAMTLAACTTESTMTGLGGGGHAVVHDGASGDVTLVDGFVTRPGLGVEESRRPATGAAAEATATTVPVVFEGTVDHYAVGIDTAGVPGVAALCSALHTRWGRVPWASLVAPARDLAVRGSTLPPSHARVLDMLAAALAAGDGAGVYAPRGVLAGAGERVRVPGLEAAFDVLAEQGGAAFQRGALAEALLAASRSAGGTLTRADLDAYRVVASPPVVTPFGGSVVACRDAFHPLSTALGALAPSLALPREERWPAVASALVQERPAAHGTTTCAAVDAAGTACAVTTSLGLGSTVWLTPYGVHLNSMLGEPALADPPLAPGERVRSDMSPLVVTDRDGLLGVAGGAGGSRIRSALAQTLLGLVVDGLPAAQAVAAPRLHTVPPVVQLEPDVPQAAERALQRAGWSTTRWRRRHHYFGGVSLVARSGAVGDDRRDGASHAVP